MDGPVERLVAYTGSREIGGAERALGMVLRAAAPGIEAEVWGVDAAVVDHVAGFRPRARRVVAGAEPAVRRPLSLLRAVRAFRRARPDVVVVNLAYPWASGWSLLAASIARRGRVVALNHANVPPDAPRQRLLRRLNHRLLAADLAVGPRSARALERLVGLPAGSVGVLPNAVEEDDEAPGSGGPPGTLVVGTLARLHPTKGVDVLLRAAARLDGVRVVVAGEGDELGPLRRLAEDLGAAARVSFEGWAVEPRALLRGLDVFCLPSRLEALPLSILEAMHCGVPVVAADVGDVAEAVVDGETGLLVPPGDDHALAAALARLRDDPALRRRLGRAGRERARERFGPRALAAEVDALLRRVAAGR